MIVEITNPVDFYKLMDKLPAFLEMVVKDYDDMGASKRAFTAKTLSDLAKSIKVVEHRT